jgi:toxin ParE1/3/4
VKRLEVAVRPSAVDDIQSIYEWIAVASSNPISADQFIQRIYDSCYRIGDFPNGGRPRDDLMAGLRTMAFERKAVIAYVVMDGRVEITNVFYGGRDFEAIYQDDASLEDTP